MLLDGVKHMVLTTGTPNATDRGAAILCASAFAIKAAVDIPIQGQCEPPDDDRWFARMYAAGIDTLGMHLGGDARGARAGHAGQGQRARRALPERLRGRGAARLRPQPGQHLHPRGARRSREAILEIGGKLLALGVYPFVVPFVPISGTPLEDHPAPRPSSCAASSSRWARAWRPAGLRSGDIKAGCGKCGACSSLSVYGPDMLHADDLSEMALVYTPVEYLVREAQQP